MDKLYCFCLKFFFCMFVVKIEVLKVKNEQVMCVEMFENNIRDFYLNK